MAKKGNIGEVGSDFEIIYKQIEKRAFLPFMMNNRNWVKKYFPLIQEKHPEAKVFYLAQIEYICISEYAYKMLLRFFVRKKHELEKDLSQVNKALEEARSQGIIVDDE